MAPLSEKDAEVRWLATVSIGMVGYGAEGPVPALIILAKDPNARVRAAALQALGRMGEAKKRAIPVVLNALDQDSDPHVRSAAAWALLGIGTDERGSVLTTLHRALSDVDPSTRQWAATGIWWATHDPSMIEVLIAEFKNTSDVASCRRILPVLGSAGELAKPAVLAIRMKLAKFEKTRPPLGDEDLVPLTRDVLCQIDPEAVEQ